jgi:hypothetical protein
MLNPDKQTVANLKALLETTIAAVHGVSSSGGLDDLNTTAQLMHQ